MNLLKYGQYKNDIFNKLNLSFKPDSILLDVGCGDGTDAEIFINEYGLKVSGIDVYEHENIKNLSSLNFQKAGIYSIPFPDASFDYIFLHDVLHHIDEPAQRYDFHIKGLHELKRVIAPGGTIVIVEGNRYNPLFYPHMVKMLGHNHFTQKYFKQLVFEVFGNKAEFQNFECHLYPKNTLMLWKIYERVMEKQPIKELLAYNVALINL